MDADYIDEHTKNMGELTSRRKKASSVGRNLTIPLPMDYGEDTGCTMCG